MRGQRTSPAGVEAFAQRLFAAAASVDKQMHTIAGATHYYAGQPAQLAEATTLVHAWLAARDLA